MRGESVPSCVAPCTLHMTMLDAVRFNSVIREL